MWNLVKIVKFGKNGEIWSNYKILSKSWNFCKNSKIWSKLWTFVKILKIGQNSENWPKFWKLAKIQKFYRNSEIDQNSEIWPNFFLAKIQKFGQSSEIWLKFWNLEWVSVHELHLGFGTTPQKSVFSPSPHLNSKASHRFFIANFGDSILGPKCCCCYIFCYTQDSGFLSKLMKTTFPKSVTPMLRSS